MPMGKILNYVLIVLIVCLLGLAGSWLYNFSLKTQPAQSSSSDNVSGWAWSRNIGWISFNNLTDGSEISYGVKVDPGNGKLSGYAWSGNIGWISFNESDTGAPPSNDPCSDTSCIAKATPPGQFGKSNVYVEGWARALAACQNNLWDGTKCTGSGAGDASGGWDGWIRFDHGKTGGSYGGEVYIGTNGEFRGWAWGGDIIGWISFNCLDAPPNCSVQGGDVCEANENCPGTIVPAGDTDECCNQTCVLKTCSEQEGDICQQNEECFGTIISASDSTSCCNIGCILKTCAQQSGDVCQTYEFCPGTIISARDSNTCCNVTCQLKTCAVQGGDICQANENCFGTILPASDSTNCCSIACELKTCAELGGEICEWGTFCNGQIIPAGDTNRCCVNGYCESF